MNLCNPKFLLSNLLSAHNCREVSLSLQHGVFWFNSLPKFPLFEYFSCTQNLRFCFHLYLEQISCDVYLIPIKISAPLNFAPLIFAPLIFAHPQISRPFNFRAPLFYCKFAFISFFSDIFFSLWFLHFCTAQLAPFNFWAG